MIVVDTTVLVFAVGAPHPLAGPCRTLVQLVGDGTVRATTTVEVLQEFVHVRARRRGREDAATLARHYLTLLSPLLAVGAEDLDAGLTAFGAHEQVGAFDAVLAAAAARAGASALVSADGALRTLPDVPVLDPAAPDFLDRVRDAG